MIYSPAVPRSTDPVTVTARLIDESQDKISAQLVYRLDGEASYQVLPMARSDAEQFTATLPPQADGQIIEFFRQRNGWPRRDSRLAKRNG